MLNEKQTYEGQDAGEMDDLEVLLRRGEQLHNQAVCTFFSALLHKLSGLWKKQPIESPSGALKQRMSH
ncbi:MAG: hypothetical protein JXQ81_01380 [Desulfuromonadales bacterium]|nr:hypothetical protein [Desulfuromonadales bacterium]MBN2791137.1 hypothetical protein [Desulfuromonadales bacterium]